MTTQQRQKLSTLERQYVAALAAGHPRWTVIKTGETVVQRYVDDDKDGPSYFDYDGHAYDETRRFDRTSLCVPILYSNGRRKVISCTELADFDWAAHEFADEPAPVKPKKKKVNVKQEAEVEDTAFDELNANKKALRCMAIKIGANTKHDWTALGLGDRYMHVVRLYKPPKKTTPKGKTIELKPSATLKQVFAAACAIEYGALECDRTVPPPYPADGFPSDWNAALRRDAIGIIDWFALMLDATRTIKPQMFAKAGERILFSREVMYCGTPWHTKDLPGKAKIWHWLTKEIEYITASPGPGKGKGRNKNAQYYAFNKAFGKGAK